MAKEEIKKDGVDEVKEEVVSIPKSQLDAIMADISRLKFAADKSQLHNYDEKNKGKIGKVVKLRTIDGKVVISWGDMITNAVEKNAAGVWKEDQTIKIQLEDKTELTMDYVFFARRFVGLEADVISEMKTDDDLIYKVKTEDGKTYEINSKFVN
jgi:hypothetical protein